MPSRLNHHVVFVTGGSSGIGRAAALACAAEGARITITGRDPARLARTAAAIQDRGAEVCARVADVRSEDAMRSAVEETVDRFGRVDVHVASAGRGGGHGTGRLPRALVQTPVEEWDDVVDTNLKGVFLSNRAVLPVMIRQGSGLILNISSSPGAIRGSPYAAPYCASKRAVVGLSRALAEEVHGHGIKVVALLPDATDTPLIADADALAPHGKMPPAAVADLMLALILQPDDMIWPEPLIAPHAFGADSPSTPPLRKLA